MRRRILTLTVAAAAAVALAVPGADPAPATAGRRRQPGPVDPAAQITAHFDLAKGQLPENIALGPDGTAYSPSRPPPGRRRHPAGRTRVLATLAAPADGGVDTPVLGFALTTGIVRTGDGTLYVLYATGDAACTGLYRLSPGRAPRRIAALPADGLPNGLALERRAGRSTSPTRCSARSGPSRWPVARPASVVRARTRPDRLPRRQRRQGPRRRGLGDQPRPGHPAARFRCGGRGRPQSGRPDWSASTTSPSPPRPSRRRPQRPEHGRGHRPRRQARTVLTGADGLQNPTSVALRGHTILVPSAAYTTSTDPNLIVATLRHR